MAKEFDRSMLNIVVGLDMRVLLTNDDGIDAPGLQALRQAVIQLPYDIVVVAPQMPHSGCSHQVTTHQPIAVEQRGEQEFAIAGTPVDCVRLALAHLCPPVDWVLSGINAGGNLGADIYVSGTVAAVREAALHRVRGIALSHYRARDRSIDWTVATHMATSVLDNLLSQSLAPGQFWNVNLPHPTVASAMPEFVICPPCTQPLPVDYELCEAGFKYCGNYANRQRDPGGDVDVCFSGAIAITKLSIDGHLSEL